MLACQGVLFEFNSARIRAFYFSNFPGRSNILYAADFMGVPAKLFTQLSKVIRKSTRGGALEFIFVRCVARCVRKRP